ncbi:MAG: adenine deaminase [Candidatus Syntrophoarchaeum caldarius]|uniref:Adenine deaminase n=1 Tax=Candidatus Syntropharchaeum caldarium TaxID=1838285 RepID=A0A1F2P9W8_9EURY|nr:MAG: adenine deaminase [Candidatus Syntrophoarchaeum caldarius]
MDSIEELRSIIAASLGEVEVDTLLAGGMVADVFAGKIEKRDVAVHNGRIVGFGNYSAKEVIDLEGNLIVPGFIDGHVHIESSMVTPPEYARAVLGLGTTSIVCDPHEIANVMGKEGIRYILDTSRNIFLNVYVMLPSCVPATAMESSGAVLRATDLLEFRGEERVRGLAELMNYPGLIAGDEEVLEKVSAFSDMIIDGHAPLLSGKELSAYSIFAHSDHECTTEEEAREKLAKGMRIMIREGTGAKNFDELIKIVTPANSRRFFFVSDDRNPLDLLGEGHIKQMVTRAINAGLDPVIAIQMATLNTAEYFNLKDIGAIAPGFIADMVVLDVLDDCSHLMTLKDGVVVAKDGKVVVDIPVFRNDRGKATINIKMDGLSEKLKISGSGTARVIKVLEDQIVTEEIREEVDPESGLPIGDDILKIAVCERHTGSGNVGLGFIKGFGIKSGAIASSVAHDSHNIVVVGSDDSDMIAAIREIERVGGGQTVVKDGSVLATLALPIAGLISDKPLEEVRIRLLELREAAKELGCGLKDPFMTLSFMALPVIPSLKVTDKGLFDVLNFEFVELFV